MSRIDLSAARVVDAHCHGFTAEDLLALDPQGWADRITVMGMCFLSSTTAHPALEGHVSAMTGSTVFALLARRWLAGHLGCTVTELPGARQRAFAADPRGYLTALYADQHVAGLLVDDGYPRPRVDPAGLSALVGTPVHTVVRIEPLIDRARESAGSAAELEDAYRALLEVSEGVAYKTVIAYRTGLDVTEPAADEVEASFRRWRAAGWADGRAVSKPLRDHLLHVALEVAARQERPLHIHSGAGDQDVVLPHVRPAGLGPLLGRRAGQPIVLIHAGYPWVEEAAYLAGMYPMAYLELSLFLPWATLDADRILTTALGHVPAAKLLYGSDEASEPEVVWISARMARAALERVLGDAVDRDFLTAAEAEGIGHDVLARNTLRLHGLEA